MRHILFEESNSYRAALLMKATAFRKHDMEINYVEPLGKLGLKPTDLIGFTLAYNEAGKAPAGFIKEYLAKLLPALVSIGVTHLYVTDSGYFKVLAGQTKAEPHYGYAMPCKIKGFNKLTIVLGTNYQALIFNPVLQAKLDLSLHTLASSIQGTYQPLGADIIHSASYPEGHQAIQEALQALHQYPSLGADIEAFSLRFEQAGIGTIAFAKDQHNGIAFPVDYKAIQCQQDIDDAPEEAKSLCGYFKPDLTGRTLLRDFLETYQGELTWHSSAYDLKVLIYTLWMKHPLDTEGLLKGLEVMTRSFQDTKIIAYLATNSTADSPLKLKQLAHEFAGNWAVEVEDIRKVPLKELLQYNLVDALSTIYVREKYYPVMVVDQQEELYYSLMLPTQKLLLQTELTGMPMSANTITEVRTSLEEIQKTSLVLIQNSPVIKMLNLLLQTSAMESANAKLKVKQHPLEKFKDVTFNPNSGPQLQRLLYEQMGMPVIDLTETKQPATGADTLDKLINHTQEPAYKQLLQALIDYGKVTKILSTFIPAFEGGIVKADGTKYLHGCFNIGGAVSGRLSSSDPNLQNIPANSLYAKLIKMCFVAPPGWLFGGADFNSLEDYISALTTKDPNKLKVYEDGFDGHCLRAAYYFRDQCPDIDPTDVSSVNSRK